MFGDIDNHSRSYQEEMRRRAEHRRMIRRALLAQRQDQPRFYKPLLAKVGKRLVAWGTALQSGYDQLQAVPPADPCVDPAR